MQDNYILDELPESDCIGFYVTPGIVRNLLSNEKNYLVYQAATGTYEVSEKYMPTYILRSVGLKPVHKKMRYLAGPELVELLKTISNTINQDLLRSDVSDRRN